MPQRRHSGDSISLASDTPRAAISYALAIEPPPWMVDALCAQTDPESFFPEKGGSTREAKAICRRCTVQAECLDYALANDERHGIWGALSERERRRVQHALRPTPAPPAIHDQQEPA